MGKLTLEQARCRVLNCAKAYHDKLENKQLLIIYRDRSTNRIMSLEPVFLARNFQHLTGLELIDQNGLIINHQAENFYRKCLENRLSKTEIAFKKDGTTQREKEFKTLIPKMIITLKKSCPFTER